ncbi:MAG: toxin-antitoxin system HicB family antitoxin [Proteobacteria bacterium]|jgi:predicted DNA-binding ribbon-helix-helix protein|nr:toxin-antitoxin system HicB family antitoxin [Ramlibacter sp.]MCA0211867.1 toxin-antitoxin system HicB family antitoxin [Pseudomonadota bacterium]
MSALTLRLPDHKHERLKAMAEQRGISLARLLDELTTQALVEFDAETHFMVRAQRGANRVERGIELLRKARGGLQ